jgi:hypothetical protein
VSRANSQSDGPHKQQCGIDDHAAHRWRIAADHCSPFARRGGIGGPPVKGVGHAQFGTFDRMFVITMSGTESGNAHDVTSTRTTFFTR